MHIIGLASTVMFAGVIILAVLLIVIWQYTGREILPRPAKQDPPEDEGARFEWYVRRSMQRDQHIHGIRDIHHLVRIQWMFFNRANYSALKEAIANVGSIEELKKISPEQNKSDEDIEIVTFRDQNGQLYAATIYDSGELWQDPEVLDIFPLLQAI